MWGPPRQLPSAELPPLHALPRCATAVLDRGAALASAARSPAPPTRSTACDRAAPQAHLETLVQGAKQARPPLHTHPSNSRACAVARLPLCSKTSDTPCSWALARPGVQTDANPTHTPQVVGLRPRGGVQTDANIQHPHTYTRTSGSRARWTAPPAASKATRPAGARADTQATAHQLRPAVRHATCGLRWVRRLPLSCSVRPLTARVLRMSSRQVRDEACAVCTLPHAPCLHQARRSGLGRPHRPPPRPHLGRQVRGNHVEVERLARVAHGLMQKP